MSEHPSTFVALGVIDQLAERLGDGFTQTSVEIFTTEINQRLSALAAVSDRGTTSSDQQRDQVVREAHAIKGAAASYGLSALSASAAELEADPARLDEIMPDLSGLWSRASAALETAPFGQYCNISQYVSGIGQSSTNI